MASGTPLVLPPFILNAPPGQSFDCVLIFFHNFLHLISYLCQTCKSSQIWQIYLCNKIGRKVEMSRLYSVQCTQTHKHTVESRAVFCLSRISDFNICFVNVSFVKILEFSYCFSCLKDLSGAKSVFWSQVKSCFHSCKGVRLPTNILTRDGHRDWNFLKSVSAHLLFQHLFAD